MADLPASLRKQIYLEPNTGCWLWMGYVNEDGYAHAGGKFDKVHRGVFQFFKGSIPSGKELHHRCRTRSCVNPEHLDAVTHAENIARGNSHLTQFKIQTHCIHGHEFTPENIYIEPTRGRRQCLICRRRAYIIGRKEG